MKKTYLKYIIAFLAVQAVTAAVLFYILSVAPVKREIMRISEQFTYTTATGSSQTAEYLNKLRDAKHHEAFLKSALSLAKRDSIALLIDLKDSLAILSLKGVYLFESKISVIKLSKGLEKMPAEVRDSLFGGPMQLSSEIVSIEKFPIVVKKAPKDTTEAKSDDSAPTLPVQNDVFAMFTFNNGMVIELAQSQKELAGHKSAYRKYKRESRSRIRKEERDYLYMLRIELPREEARSIYRALPLRPYVVVRY